MRRTAIGKRDKWEPATRRLLTDVPTRITESWPVRRYGVSEGMAMAAYFWRGEMAAGIISEADMRSAIIPVAALTSAMLEALLRGVPIDERAGAFELLARESRRLLTGRPNAVIIQAGIT